MDNHIKIYYSSRIAEEYFGRILGMDNDFLSIKCKKTGNTILIRASLIDKIILEEEYNG